MWEKTVWVPHNSTEENIIVWINACASQKIRVEVTKNGYCMVTENVINNGCLQISQPIPKYSFIIVLICVWWNYEAIM